MIHRMGCLTAQSRRLSLRGWQEQRQLQLGFQSQLQEQELPQRDPSLSLVLPPHRSRHHDHKFRIRSSFQVPD